MNEKIITLILSITFITSCSAYTNQIKKNESSGFIGCHPNQISIEEEDFTGFRWTAKCKDVIFYCSKTEDQVNCKEAR